MPNSEERLLVAAKESDMQTISKILRRDNVDINYQNHTGYTALAYAVENNHEVLVALLLEQTTIIIDLEVEESQDSIGGMPLHIAAFRGYDRIVSMLIEHSREHIDAYEYCGYTPLHETVLNGKYSTFKLLIQQGADPEAETAEDVASTGIPEGINTLGLIMYQLLQESSFIYIDKSKSIHLIKMLAYLLTKKGISMPEEEYFSENELDCKLYKLIEDYFTEPENLLNKLYQLFDIKQENLRDETVSGAFGDFSYLSDSDSEGEFDYKYANQLEISRNIVCNNINETFPKVAERNTLIPHFRGTHFYPKYFDKAGRGLVRKLSAAQALGEIPMQAIYSSAAHELANVPYQLPFFDGWQNTKKKEKYKNELLLRDQKLQAVSPKVIIPMQALKDEKDVATCLHKPGKTSKKIYENRYYELVQRYVNSYAALQKDMKIAPTKDTTRLRSDSSKMKSQVLKGLGFTSLPFVSTTEDTHWGFDYAFSLINYDKSDTHKPARNVEIQPLLPYYQSNGRPRFPYMGIVHATLHSENELITGLNSRIIDLFANSYIDTRCAAPGGHVTGGYIRAKERVFVNDIDARHIFVAMIVRVPNLSNSYKDFMLDKYGMSREQYGKFQLNLQKYSQLIKNKNSLVNEKQFFRTQHEIIKHVIEYQQKQLLAFLESCALDQGFDLQIMGSEQGELMPPKVLSSNEEKAFIKRVLDARKIKMNEKHLQLNHHGQKRRYEENNDEVLLNSTSSMKLKK